MKYLKLYENFVWDFDWEEEIPININKGDTIKKGQRLYYWGSDKWLIVKFSDNKKIDKIATSENITSNPYNGYYFTPIPDKNVILFSIKGHWPWFKYDDNVILENFNWTEDDFDEEEFEEPPKNTINKKIKVIEDILHMIPNNTKLTSDVINYLLDYISNTDDY